MIFTTPYPYSRTNGESATPFHFPQCDARVFRTVWMHTYIYYTQLKAHATLCGRGGRAFTAVVVLDGGGSPLSRGWFMVVFRSSVGERKAFMVTVLRVRTLGVNDRCGILDHRTQRAPLLNLYLKYIYRVSDKNVVTFHLNCELLMLVITRICCFEGCGFGLKFAVHFEFTRSVECEKKLLKTKEAVL